MQKSAALQELIDKVCGRQENRSCNFICQIDKSIETCTALTQRVSNTRTVQRINASDLKVLGQAFVCSWVSLDYLIFYRTTQ